MPTIYVLSKNKKNIQIVPIKFSIFTAEKKNLCILRGQVFVMTPQSQWSDGVTSGYWSVADLKTGKIITVNAGPIFGNNMEQYLLG